MDSIRFVSGPRRHETPTITSGVDVFGAVADALGLTPDSRVRVLICVEGPTDVDALSHLSAALHIDDPTLPNLFTDSRFAFVPLGGSALKHWVARQYLGGLNLPEAHIYDNDVRTYAEAITEVNSRTNGSWAVQTAKHEIECYLHADAVRDGFGFTIAIADDPTVSTVLPPFCAEYSRVNKLDSVMKHPKAKLLLAQRAWCHMTPARIYSRDHQGEIVGWFRRLKQML